VDGVSNFFYELPAGVEPASPVTAGSNLPIYEETPNPKHNRLQILNCKMKNSVVALATYIHL
jgi:hypothetical protein